MLIIAIIFALIAITFTVYAACVIAGDADEREEKMWEERGKKHDQGGRPDQ